MAEPITQPINMSVFANWTFQASEQIRLNWDITLSANKEGLVVRVCCGYSDELLLTLREYCSAC